MKKIIGLGALLTGTLLFAGSAQAGLFDRFHPCPCQPQPACPPAATASVEGTTTYSPTYQPAESARAVQPSRPVQRSNTLEAERRKIKGL